MGDDEEATGQPVAWEGMPAPPPGSPGGVSHGLGPEHDMVALLSRISENTRMTRQYVGWIALVATAGLVLTAAWLFGVITLEFTPVEQSIFD